MYSVVNTSYKGNMAEAYSYHTFILPFSWSSKGDSYEGFVEYFENNDNWTCTDMEDSNDIGSARTVDTEEERLQLYKEYQYFYPYARKAIYGFDEKIVRNYSFMHELLHDKATYHICKGKKEYVLILNAIRLKIYNTGVALFIMECQNCEKNQWNLAAVKDINDYGRRISLPFIPEGKDGFSLCADKLSVEVDGMEFVSDFKGYIAGERESISLNHIADYIKEILDFGGMIKETFSSHKVDSTDRFWIYPMLGDRMFVQSFILDKKEVAGMLRTASGSFRNLPEIDQEYAYKRDQEKAKSLYELAYVDPANGVSVSDNKMLLEFLKDALYTRWIDSGSMYMVTNYSCILLTNYADHNYRNSFLTQYYQMFCLAIAQRASIKVFKRKIASISSDFKNKRNGNKKKKILQKIITLEEEYIEFTSQLCFSEVSPEQQGIELYDLMKKQFRLKDETDSLKEQIEGLYNVANIRNENESNNMMNALTWIAFIVSIASMAISTMQISGFLYWLTDDEVYEHSIKFGMNWEAIVVVVSFTVSLVLSGIILIRSKYKNRKF